MVSKDFNQTNPEDAKAELALLKKKEEDKKDKKLRKEMGGKHASSAEIVAKLDEIKRLQTFDRFNHEFVDTYMQKRYQDKLPARNKEA